jgi:3-oxoacyl-[acyl-carrier-protein] synthase-1
VLRLYLIEQGIADSGLSEAQVANPRTGIIAGSGGASSRNIIEAAKILHERGLKRIGPYRVTQTMCLRFLLVWPPHLELKL